MPTATQADGKQRGNPVYIGFGAKNPSSGGNSNKVSLGSNWNGAKSVTTYLGLEYVYDEQASGYFVRENPATQPGNWTSGSGGYLYGVTLPFVSVCVNSNGSCTQGL